MRARDVLGKRIVKVEQQVRTDSGKCRCQDIVRIHLDDGSRIYFTVREGEADYIVVAHSTKEFQRQERRERRRTPPEKTGDTRGET